jgi:hypothetical protein
MTLEKSFEIQGGWIFFFTLSDKFIFQTNIVKKIIFILEQI